MNLKTSRFSFNGVGMNKVIKAEFVKDIGFRDFYELDDKNKLDKLIPQDCSFQVAKVLYYDKEQEKGLFISNGATGFYKGMFKSVSPEEGYYFVSPNHHFNENVVICEDRKSVKTLFKAKEEAENYTNGKEHNFLYKNFVSEINQFFGEKQIDKEMAEKLKEKLMDNIEKQYQELKIEKENEEEEEEESSMDEVDNRSEWQENSILKISVKDSYYQHDLVEVNKSTYKIDSKKIISLNRNWNEFFTRWDIRNDLKNKRLIPILKKFWDLYNNGLDKKLKLKYHNPKGLNYEITFKKNGSGIFFFDKRIRKNKYKQVLEMLMKDKNKKKRKKELKKKIKFFNKFAAVRREMMEAEELTVSEELTDSKTDLPIEFDVQTKNKWKMEIGHKEYEVEWNLLKEYFTRGRETKITKSYHTIDAGKFYEFLSKISGNAFDDYKEIMLMNNI